MRSLLSESDEPTILHTHFTSLTSRPRWRPAGTSSAAKVFWHVHTPNHGSLAIRARNRLKYAVLGQPVERILCVSPELANVDDQRGAPRSPVEFMHNAVDVQRFRLLERRSADRPTCASGFRPTSRCWSTSNGTGTVRAETCSCTRYALRERGIEAVGVTVGGGDPGRPFARARAGPRHARARADRRRRTTVLAADVFMSPSRPRAPHIPSWRPSSSGTPVVASDIPGHAAKGANCIVLIHAARPGAIADAAQKLIDREPHEVSADGLAGHLWMRENLHLPKWSAGLVERPQHALARLGRRLRRRGLAHPALRDWCRPSTLVGEIYRPQRA